ncbi:energy transducer TonB [Hymenobacter gummosus]|uniref:Energy transducer TonB n=1 Tax=Hymenobacter gummosus TaxID=1776032 RepID=A0A3S0H440_9BACT|nr:energy transducer TonB [Hymenobacter gummosus]RTQ47153.1 energy transducer TonB [Hymenobacter gummosus]
MLHALPIRNVGLDACPENWAQMTPVAGGRHCASCQRVVIDFRQATEPELAWARLAAPDGRVCGQFRSSQLAPESRPLRPRLRWFLLAAVLVLVQGLSAQQAWAQVQRPAAGPPPPPPPPGGLRPPATPPRAARYARFEGRPLYQFVDQMPVYKHGGVDGLQRDLAAQLHWPPGRACAEGSVFVRFVVDRAGRIRTPRVVKGIAPGYDAQALQAVSGLRGFAPGRQQGQAVDVEYTVPVKFVMRPAETPPPAQ